MDILKKHNKTGLYVGIGAGAAVAAALAYLYMTYSGSSVRGSISEKAKDIMRDVASNFISKKTGVDKHTVRKVAEHIG